MNSSVPQPAHSGIMSTILRIIANRAMNMAAYYQPEFTGKDGQKKLNKNFREDRYAYWLAAAREANARAAPYYSEACGPASSAANEVRAGHAAEARPRAPIACGAPPR
jgi:hypothetical protein